MIRATLLHAAALACFFAGLFFVTQAYTMAFHGVYLDCFGTFYVGRLAFRAGRRSAS